MSELRVVDGVMEHNIAPPSAPAEWVRVAHDETGRALPEIRHGEKPAAVLDELSGNIILSCGGAVVQFPLAVAGELADAIVALVPGAQAVKLAERVENDARQHERERQQRLLRASEAIVAEESALRAELTDRLAQDETALRAELAERLAQDEAEMRRQMADRLAQEEQARRGAGRVP